MLKGLLQYIICFKSRKATPPKKQKKREPKKKQKKTQHKKTTTQKNNNTKRRQENKIHILNGIKRHICIRVLLICISIQLRTHRKVYTIIKI